MVCLYNVPDHSGDACAGRHKTSHHRLRTFLTSPEVARDTQGLHRVRQLPYNRLIFHPGEKLGENIDIWPY